MIKIKPVYENIVMITDENYTTNRISILKNLFQELSLTIFDYEIRIIKEDTIFEEYVDICPYNLDEDFFVTLKKFEEMEKETDENLKFTIKILAIIKKEN